MFDHKAICERTKILAPILNAAYKNKRQEWPAYDGTPLNRGKFVSSSSIGNCARRIKYAQIATLNGSVKEFTDWGYAERGHAHEAWIVEMLHLYDGPERWTYIGKDQVSFFDEHQSGTPDGLLEIDGKIYVVDFKSIDPRKAMAKLPDPKHIDQLIQNMDLIEVCLDMSVDGALICYSNCSNFQTITEYTIDRNLPQVGERMQYLQDRATMINTAEKPEQLEPEGMYNGDCDWCDFKHLCSAAVELTNIRNETHERGKRIANRLFG